MNQQNHHRRLARTAAVASLAVVLVLAAASPEDPPASRPDEADGGPAPTLGARPPAMDDATVVLFDGAAWAGWHQRDGAPSRWSLQDDGSIVAGPGDALSDLEFTDVQVHLEFLCPPMPGTSGQGRANSGVYLLGRYEVQVLDSFGDEPAVDGCGALYSIAPPAVNASRPAGEWQTYDIVFRGPRLHDDGTVARLPLITVLHNGVAIHNNVELPHPTRAGLDMETVAAGPLLLQDHGDPVRYRNIWLRRLDE